MHQPVCTEDGDLEAALYGSFLPIPSQDLFPITPESEYLPEKTAGAIIPKHEDIVLNQGRARIRLRVTNTGDRPIQVGSHYPFIETNRALSFDRLKSYGKRLDIAAGTAVRFEPGDTKTITLVSISGNKVISGGNGLASGPMGSLSSESLLEEILRKDFAHAPEPGALEVIGDTKIGRETYISMFGPTVGDKVRLGDTELWIEVEHDEVNFQFLVMRPVIDAS